jgi:hypothetical protein
LIKSSPAFFRYNFKPKRNRKVGLVFKSHPVFPQLPSKSDTVSNSSGGATAVIRPELGLGDQGKLKVHQVYAPFVQETCQDANITSAIDKKRQFSRSYDGAKGILTLVSCPSNHYPIEGSKGTQLTGLSCLEQSANDDASVARSTQFKLNWRNLFKVLICPATRLLWIQPDFWALSLVKVNILPVAPQKV